MWNTKKAHGYVNFTTTLFLNLNYTGSPNQNLEFYCCNSSFNISGGTAPQDDAANCAYLNGLTSSFFDTRSYTSRNSSYVKATFSVVEGKIAGIGVTNKTYVYFRSNTIGAGTYIARYANESSGTNVSFKDSKVAWISTDDGDSFTQAEFTPDIWFSQITSGSQFELGVYARDTLNNTYTNFSIYTDGIGISNYPIGQPAIYAYQNFYNTDENNHSNEDEDLNGTYTDNMTIRINAAIDPDAVGSVNHSLYLMNLDGSLNYTINNSFYSSDDSDVLVHFNTRFYSFISFFYSFIF